MKPYIHSSISVKKYGGQISDYQKIHDWFDSSKKCLPDMRHRMLLHNSFGIYLAEELFGITITNSDSKQISVRDIAEDHVLQDLGFIPTVEKCFESMELLPWMSGTLKRKTYKMKDLVD